jgi:hypothetical protein
MLAGKDVVVPATASAFGSAAIANTIAYGPEAGLKAGAFAAAFAFVGANIPGAMSPERIIAHAVLGCVQQASSGGQCGPGAAAAAFGKIATGLTQDWGEAAQFAVTTVVGGTVSVIGGGKFANGAGQAGFGYLFNQMGGRGNRGQGPKQPGWGYEYPEVDHPFAPNDEFKARFFGSEEERRVWFRTQEIAAGRAESREWLRFDDPKVQLPRSGGPLYQIFDLGLAEAGALRIAYSPKIPNVFYVSLDHYQPTPAQPLRWTRFEAAPPKN